MKKRMLALAMALILCAGLTPPALSMMSEEDFGKWIGGTDPTASIRIPASPTAIPRTREIIRARISKSWNAAIAAPSLLRAKNVRTRIRTRNATSATKPCPFRRPTSAARPLI